MAEETYAVLKTTHGDITVRLFPNHAPKTVRNFVELAEGGFEGVYQSSAVIPRWIINADSSRRWSVRLAWTMGRAVEGSEDSRGE